MVELLRIPRRGRMSQWNNPPIAINDNTPWSQPAPQCPDPSRTDCRSSPSCCWCWARRWRCEDCSFSWVRPALVRRIAPAASPLKAWLSWSTRCATSRGPTRFYGSVPAVLRSSPGAMRLGHKTLVEGKHRDNEDPVLMRAVHGRLDGPCRIEEDLAVYGMVTGSAEVVGGSRLILHGTVAGDLIIDTGASASIHGTVTGWVRNMGGKAEIFGVVNGAETLPGGVTTIRPGALVRQPRSDAPAKPGGVGSALVGFTMALPLGRQGRQVSPSPQ